MKNTHMETRSLLDRLWTRKIKKYSSDIFNLFKQIWNNRDIVIIEGDKTLFGVNNELLNNASTIKRIIAPALNAYDYKNEIIQGDFHKINACKF